MSRAPRPPKPDAPPAVTAALNAIAEPSAAVPPGSGSARREATTAARVTFGWEPIAAAPGAAPDPSVQAARIALTASSSDGKQLYKGRVPEEAAAAATGGAVQFDGPPGSLQMRSSSKDSGGR